VRLLFVDGLKETGLMPWNLPIVIVNTNFIVAELRAQTSVLDETGPACWTLLLTHIFRHWLGGKWSGMLPPEAESLLSR
jgi:hypothetical protein